MYAIQPPYTGGGTMIVGCIAVYRCMCAVRVYALLYGTRAQRRGVDSPSNIELTPRANDVVSQASHGIHSVMVV